MHEPKRGGYREGRGCERRAPAESPQRAERERALDRRGVAFRERRCLVESPTQLRIVGEAPRDFGGGVAALELLLVLWRAVEPRGEARGGDLVGSPRLERDEPLGRSHGLALGLARLATHSGFPPSRR